MTPPHQLNATSRKVSLSNTHQSKFSPQRKRRDICRSWLVSLLLLPLPVVVQAQLTFTTNNGAITITGYAGPGGAVTIPDTINGLPVTSIGDFAFYNLAPHSPTIVTIPDSVTNIGNYAFDLCTALSSVTLGNGLTTIGEGAFAGCPDLTGIAIPSNVLFLGDGAFAYCGGMLGVYFEGNAPGLGGAGVFQGDYNIVYYLSGTSGWGPTFGGRPTAVWYPQELWHYTNINGTITITGYTGPGGAVTIPGKINGHPVTSIGDWALNSCKSLTSVTIGSTVTSIGAYGFFGCLNLTSITIGDSVTSIGNSAFFVCGNLTSVYFRGNAPSLGSHVFDHSELGYQVWDPVTSYYLPGTTGWASTFGGRPTAPWYLPHPLILTSGPSFGVQTNGFGFIISWATNLPVVVEAATILANPTWSPAATNTLTNGSSYFSDPQWTNYPARFYRLRSP
jgi:hypothetical protein